MNKFMLTALALPVMLFSYSANASQELTVYEDNNKSFGIEKAAREFARENGCKVNIVEVDAAGQLAEVEKAIKEGRSVPDVFIIMSDRVGEAVSKNLIAKLDNVKKDKDHYTSRGYSSFLVNGNMYAAPRSIETLVIYYNKALLEYPYENFDDYVKLSNKLKSAGKVGLLGKFDALYISYGFLAANGGYVFGKEDDGDFDTNDIGLASEKAASGLADLVKLTSVNYPDKIFSDNGWALVDEYFTEGKAAAVVNGPWALGTYAKSGIDYGVAPLPELSSGNPIKPFFGTKGYAVTEKSENKELAEKFIRYLNRSDNALKRYSEIAELPPIVEVLNNPLITNDDFANAIATQVQNSDAMPSIPEMGLVWEPVSNAISQAIKGEANARDALKNAVDTIKSNIDD
ncbi:MAG: extracellular solute-binding protein [Succinivibrio sp.]